MNDEKPDDIRSRDDTRLHRLVSETRQWMKDEGIEEAGLDSDAWDAVAREQRVRWWRKRLDQALADLAAGGGELAAWAERRLARLRETPGTLLAAVELTMGAVGRITGVLSAGAAGLQFSYASPGIRSKLGLPADEDQSVAILVSSEIPGARVIVDGHQRRIVVEFWEEDTSGAMLLVPEDPEQLVRVAPVLRIDHTPKATFDEVPAGPYLLELDPEERTSV